MKLIAYSVLEWNQQYLVSPGIFLAILSAKLNVNDVKKDGKTKG